MIGKRFANVLGVVLVAAWLCVALPASAQLGGSMEGELRGIDGQPMAGISVLIDRQDIRQHFETKTDAKGHWFHAGLPSSNNYTITFKQGDRVVYTFSRVPVRLGETTKVDINLKEEMEKAQRAAPQETEEVRRRREAAEKTRASFDQLKKRFEQGLAYLTAKQYDLAVTELEACAQMDPTQHVVFANLGDAYNGVGRYDDAVTAYQKAIGILAGEANTPDKNMREAAYHNNLGSIYGRMGKTPEASAEFAKAAELEPPGAGRYYFNMGAIMINTGKTDEAVEAFRKAIAADPNYADAYYRLGEALSAKATLDPSGKVIPAPGTVEALQRYLELQPQGPYAQQAKGFLTWLGSEIQTQVSTRKTTRKK